ncbi:MAG: transporter [Bacteroidia bacterium]|nr:MAG: transporter [Bacteroidia bacterium]
MKKKIIILLICYSWISNFLNAQLGDSTIYFKAFIQNILQFHPYVQNLNLQTIQKSKAYILKNRGYFDPKTYYSFDQKLFQTKNYYSIVNSGIKIPTWIGADLKAEYDYNTGLYINSSDFLPPNGLWSAGISMPVLKNLFIDERRWLLKTAKLDLKIAEQEYNAEVLDFLSNAVYRYWEWFEAYNKLLIIKNAKDVSYQRLQATVQSALLGDLPAIDTVETAIQYNNFLLQYKISEAELQNVKNNIQFFLQWDNNKFNFINNYSFYPEQFNSSNTQNILLERTYLDSMINQHPAYKKYQFKLRNLNIEKRFRIEMLKPELNVTYNALLIPTHPNDVIYNSNNYKWGISFSFPLLLRKERGDLKLVNLKIRETINEAEIKRTELFIKANNYYNLYKVYAEQLITINDLIKRYEKMLEAERAKFFAGESSVFLVNARENYLLDARLKQISFYSKLNIYKYLFQISLGQLPQ